jgi:hypothetical protein
MPDRGTIRDVVERATWAAVVRVLDDAPKALAVVINGKPINQSSKELSTPQRGILGGVIQCLIDVLLRPDRTQCGRSWRRDPPVSQ